MSFILIVSDLKHLTQFFAYFDGLDEVMGNMMGIFVTPALLMYFFGTAIELPFLNMVLKLCNKVLVPVAIGQVLRATSAKQFFVDNKKAFKSLQEVSSVCAQTPILLEL